MSRRAHETTGLPCSGRAGLEEGARCRIMCIYRCRFAEIFDFAGRGLHQGQKRHSFGPNLWERKKSFVGQHIWARGHFVRPSVETGRRYENTSAIRSARTVAENRAGSAAKAEAPTLSEHRAHVGVRLGICELIMIAMIVRISAKAFPGEAGWLEFCCVIVCVR